MSDREHEQSHLRELVLRDLRSSDEEARGAFEREFGSATSEFVEATTTALDLWVQFRDPIQDSDQRRVAVTAVAFTAINQNIASYKLFMSGHTVAAGALFRQVLEGVSLAFLCSAKSSSVLDRFLANKYSTNKAVGDLARLAKKAHVNRAALQTVIDQYEFYHQYAHLTRLTIAAGANFSLGGLPNVGAHFDPGKLPEYAKEIRSRVRFAKILPNFVIGLTRNVTAW
jgi:hypothetical protein